MERERKDRDPEAERTLWQRWQTRRDAQTRAELFDLYATWSRVLAGHYHGRYPHPLAEYADYVSLASMGLLQAIDGFDPTLGTRFKSYAEPFIKGAVLKGLSCYVRDQQQTTRERLLSVAGEAEEGDDLAAIVNLTVGLAFGYFLEVGILDADLYDNDPSNLYERQNSMETLAYLVEQLTDGERQVITGHYYQQLSFVQISEMMGVSKARVSQLHGQGLKKLRRLYELVH
ncbi:sigma-70 family RNA polymerase sigma factor [Pseudomonas paralcaligenes]|uniref:sigma-70 family RNA polymerase sigma factor n=1 Tax=Pseudomonas paralcaligenes TaxID=2772558 RepID=UPI001C819202|nr:sigma-70 family RNA polymerase sigma factor [Pseudomonas paralcaligenes]